MTSSLAGRTIIASLAAALLAGTVNAAEFGPRGGRFMSSDRMAERVKERCDAMKERLAKMDRDLSAAQIKDIIEGRLAQSGDDNLKVGKAGAKGDVVTIDIVTKTGAKVSSHEFSTKTGLPVGAGSMCDRAVERMEQAADRRDERRGPMMGGPGLRGGLGLIGDMGLDRDLELSMDQARKLAEAGLILMGNPNLKVGEIKEKNADTYVVDIVAADNSLVAQREINRHTGRPARRG
ncbi:MAG: hypothetical protein FJX59_08325 [Alphaproteobacteria bacterium]|nr:hypothetical protein [Alphaproteobacteria bacterium]